MCATMVDAHTSRMCISHRRMPRGAARRRSQCIGVTGDATRGLCARSDKQVHVNTVPCPTPPRQMSKVKDPPAVWPLGSSRGAGCGRGPRSLVAPGRRRAAGGRVFLAVLNG